MTYIFLFLGSLTSFLDLLTFPLAVMTMPLLVMIYSDIFEYNRKPLPEIGKVLGCTGLFGTAYAITWSSKWYIVHKLIGANSIDSALGQAYFRMFGDDNMITSSEKMIALRDNFFAVPILKDLVRSPITWVILILCFLISKKIKRLWDCLPVYLISFMPYVWYYIMANHSYFHSWFTCRAQMGTLFSILFLLFAGFCEFFSILPIHSIIQKFNSTSKNA